MHRVLLFGPLFGPLLGLLMVAAASPAAAQSCATLGSQPDCRSAAPKQPANAAKAPRAERDVQMQGSAETTISNYGVSTTLENRVIEQHGVVEFGFSGSAGKPCRHPGYGTLCD